MDEDDQSPAVETVGIILGIDELPDDLAAAIELVAQGLECDASVVIAAIANSPMDTEDICGCLAEHLDQELPETLDVVLLSEAFDGYRNEVLSMTQAA